MTLLDEFNAQKPPPKVTVAKSAHPKGWEPGVQWDGTKGEAVIRSDTPPDEAMWSRVVADFTGLDSALWELVPGPVQLRAWDQAIGNGETQRATYYRVLIQRRSDTIARTDVDELCAAIMRRKPLRPPTGTTAARALVALASDWQIGKGGEANGGTAGTVDRIMSSLDASTRRVRELAKLGRPVSSVYLVGLGDIVEGCSGHYASQSFTVDLDDREQDRIARRLIIAAIDRLAPLVERVVVAAVPGNHGENRNGAGKLYTRVTDNRDLSVFENVAEVCAANPARYGHVSFVLADAYTLTLDVCGVPIGFAHGHRGTGGGQAKIEAWWKGQALGRQPVADASILCVGHYHHLLVTEATGRAVLQAPAMDPGSQWFTDQTGQSSQTGMLTFVAGTDCGSRGWSDLAVLS